MPNEKLNHAENTVQAECRHASVLADMLLKRSTSNRKTLCPSIFAHSKPLPKISRISSTSSLRHLKNTKLFLNEKEKEKWKSRRISITS